MTKVKSKTYCNRFSKQMKQLNRYHDHWQEGMRENDVDFLKGNSIYLATMKTNISKILIKKDYFGITSEWLYIIWLQGSPQSRGRRHFDKLHHDYFMTEFEVNTKCIP